LFDNAVVNPALSCLLRWVAALLLPWLAACSVLGPPPLRQGQPEADVIRDWGPPTARYAMPDGVQRLEYATGPYGRTTWMIDLDASGGVLRADQVLNESNFLRFQARAPGMTIDELLRTLGRPGDRESGGRQGGEVWSWRYPTNDCLWFRASIGVDGLVRDGVYGIDPRCQAGDGLRSN
jgi:hypothetical protein